MGGGNWSARTYDHTTRARQAAGQSTFAYSDQAAAGIVDTVNPLLDPLVKAGPTSPFAGKVMREVTISAEHPEPTAIAVVLDVTGSNITAATRVHEKLPRLLGVLQRKGYVADPQINFCAVGDAHSDKYPLQVGQFESDNRLDEQLAALILEGYGGAQMHETYELAAYYLARHTHQEPLTKQGRKGFVFFIGDELPYEVVRRFYGRHSLESLTGDIVESDIPTAQIFEELKTQYEVFFLFQKQGSYKEGEILPTWRKLLGERALVLDDPNVICEVIAGILAIVGGGLEAEEAINDLRAIGTDPVSLRAAGKALATVSGGSIVKTTGNLPDVPSDGGGTTRL